MTACSDAELEPGPITLLDEDAIVLPPSPPVFTPLAHEFSSGVSPIYAELDAIGGIFDAEHAIDLGGDIADGLGSVAHLFSSGVNAEALANLQTAEDGFRVAVDKTASLQSWLPPDVQTPAGFSVITFRVTAPDGAGVAGALIQLDADFGAGTTRATDGDGVCLFPVGFDATVAYTITAPGFAVASGVAAHVENFQIVRVTLQPA